MQAIVQFWLCILEKKKKSAGDIIPKTCCRELHDLYVTVAETKLCLIDFVKV